jgi:glyoxylase-like metal-dependent hydrolase (beta-lactamase superfamily II)
METIAEGVHLVRGGFPRLMNVYLIEDGAGGVTVFDAGVKSMAGALQKAAAKFGGIKRIVLGHSHPDHRGAAAELARGGAEIYCHEAELGDAEGDGGMHYFKLEQLKLPARLVMRHSLVGTWDGGPVAISGVLSEGDSIAGFEVVHLPGHAPGLIGLYRESDGLVLGSDVVYTLNPLTARKGAPRMPLDAFNLDTSVAMASARKLAALGPQRAWLGHADGIEEDLVDVLDELGRKGGVLGG